MYEAIRFIQQEDRVIVTKSGQLVMDLEWQNAVEFGRALLEQGRKAQEWAMRQQIVIDQAILTRSGIDLPLATHPKIQEEALKESRWNRALRRFIQPKRAMPERIGRLQVKRGH